MTPTPHIVGIRPVGDRAILVELPGMDAVLSLRAFLTNQPEEGQLDVVAAESTVLITAASTAAAARIARKVRAAELSTPQGRDDAVVVIDTVYDGEDLGDAAASAGMTPEALVSMHSQQLWTAAFGGFAPGFAYLVSAVAQPPIPRRKSPRTSVPAGTVAMAGRYSAVYPGASPGGWQLIGRTAARLWDPARESPALISPGNRVQFRPVREVVAVRDVVAAGNPKSTTAATPASVVVRASGLQTTVQDLGREGLADIGVTGSGALDRASLRRANRLVGNDPGAAALETVLGGLVLEAVHVLVLAVTGTPARLTITSATGTAGMGADRCQDPEAPFALLAGESLTIGRPASGFRSYVAFRGGVDVPSVLGSRSTDLLSGSGPAPIVAGMVLPIGQPSAHNVVGNPETPPPPPPEITTFRYVPGPRAEWFTPEAAADFHDQVWTVSPASNRIGLRLLGDPLTQLRDAELASEGTVKGTIQVPPSGLPVFFLADHPVTGGYPAIGVVIGLDLDKAGQLAPGAQLRFQPVPDAGPVPVQP